VLTWGGRASTAIIVVVAVVVVVFIVHRWRKRVAHSEGRNSPDRNA
jgi:membrane protein YdbS with pleckstrin-like domain